ncbi:GNAT family N-acetyltransferase [Paenarthrobacter ureafaciens]|jgi:hypothetical protein|uniref:GNAT family N-acetyltransferase n=1 Tax=Paenarthrobacter ureafaciens TaxID=37931 RepID=UPI001FB3B6FD|nr:GNAT family N-acetyltransferase [Paenarthrobacter ureafaciens]UOD80779.1 GNAT family N-acetyltransferase [Paenarthrobacter ureafaciens]WNZ03438.1 GNAT family N-acetyltransferase [Paenarthrobacter ureafaciens]
MSQAAARFLEAYDAQLRTEAEIPGALTVHGHGPLLLAAFVGGRGFITYRGLGGADHQGIQALVAEALNFFRSQPHITNVEWKSRGHDHAPGLHDALLANGFTADEPESIMIGEARTLNAEVPVPDGVRLRRVVDEPDVRAMSAMQDGVFGGPVSKERADELLHRLSLDDSIELWVAEAEGRMVSAGRLEPVPGTDFAGIWGGATLPEWRGRGIYRALTARRAQSALARGKTLINSDSTEFSRPILERSGLIKVSTTTPYRWVRG